jgi:hypothetical protein
VPDSFEALAVIFFAVLPGAAFVYAMERQVGAWGIKATDRILRFIALSAALYLLLLPYGYVLFRTYILSGDLVKKGHFSWWHWLILAGHWLVLLAYFGLLPWLLGTWCAKRIKAGDERVGEMFGHQMRPPRAFDYLFQDDQSAGIVRMLVVLQDKATWVAGSFSDEEGSAPADEGRPMRAFVSGYPEEPEIYLPVRIGCDPATGALELGADGNLVTEDVGVLVSGAKIAYLEFIDG